MIWLMYIISITQFLKDKKKGESSIGAVNSNFTNLYRLNRQIGPGQSIRFLGPQLTLNAKNDCWQLTLKRELCPELYCTTVAKVFNRFSAIFPQILNIWEKNHIKFLRLRIKSPLLSFCAAGNFFHLIISDVDLDSLEWPHQKYNAP